MLDRKTPLAERILARTTGPTRAAAIYGDLLELSTTRTRLWFYTAYIRTLISLTWRIPAAFLCALASLRLMFAVVVPWLSWRMTAHLSDPGLFREQEYHVNRLFWNLTLVAAQCLFFVLPYVMLRFGLRNRLTYLACALLLVAAPVYTASPLVRDLSCLCMLLTIVVALAVPLWRRPLIVLVTTLAAAASTGILIGYTVILYGAPYVVYKPPMTYLGRLLYEIFTFLIASYVCTRLHRRLLEPRPSGITHA